ncbi:outer membrane beta-barrel protein [Mucilaginibacter arboris]|uniref:Outer membrane beta-barrel protein n=1 Tax=Mucilaginibacter arboris TaxID=2682090 RepID=A0A7K1SWQ5_9SPHI|nr:outer membrane beta-barrel protein [Mucilaginibacter arboris]MVN21677.1 outer membrane beta-barrel protein [Mucilaginibacter arboris]
MMENENFDEELKNRIKQVFEEYDDGTAEEGWNLLREKYPEKNRRKYFFRWFGSAAALIFIAFVFWLYQPDILQNKVSKVKKQQAKNSVAALPHQYFSPKKAVSGKILPETNTQKTPVKTALGFTENHLRGINKIVKQRIAADTVNTEKTPVKTVPGFIPKQVLAQKEQADLSVNKQEVSNQNNTSFTGIKNVSDSTAKQAKIQVPVPADSSGRKQLVIAKKTNTPVVKPAVLNKAAKAETVKNPVKKSSIFSLELYAGPHLNYASGSNNQLGLGAGVSTDFRLAKNFKISTGLGLMQNNLTYNQNIPNGSLLAASNYATMPSSSITVTNSSLSSINASLVALDIPVNLTYTFLPGKNSMAVSAGFSSNTFVKEAYDYHYNTSTSTTQNIKSFNNFNFAKTLNIAVGFAYPLGKNKLQIEPFLKYPLGGLGSQQLLFGSAGINLKLDLQQVKK